jgi:predicted permease
VVSGNYFRLLGVPMAVGVGFGPEVQDGVEGIPEVVMSHAYWSRSFGQDQSVLGRPIFLNGEPFQVVGITRPEFRGINPGEPLPDLFIPILSAELLIQDYRSDLRRFQADGSPSASRFLRLVARLTPGTTLATAQAESEVLQRRWEEEFSAWSQTVFGELYQVRLRSEFSLAAFEARLLRRQLYFLWFFAGAVFLIGCANLAILLLASASSRESEMGIRASLGAGRGRLLSQLVTESLVLSALGGLVGLGVAYLASGLVSATVSMDLQGSLTPDGSAIAFTLFLSTLAAVLFGTAPAWTLAQTDVGTLIQRTGQGRTRALFRGGLVVTQTALSLLLLIGGGLLAKSVRETQRIDLGFDPENRVFLSVLLDNHGYSEEEGAAFVPLALERLARIPGVRHASTCNRIPFLGSNTWTFTVPGTDYAEDGLQMRFNLAGPDYFEAMGISMVAGRAFTSDDVPSTQQVAVVNEAFAERMWPGESPLGRSVDFAEGQMEVVGVAGNSVYNGVTESPSPFVYIPSLQWHTGRQNFIVSTEAAVGPMVAQMDRALRELDPNLGVAPILFSDLVDSQLSDFRIWAALIAAFAGIALFLALVGLYGVQSFLVARRTKEIGLRMAMGAEARGVVAGVVRSGLIMGGIGIAIGITAALGLSTFMRGVFFGVSPNDPLIYAVVSALLLASCLVASLVPAIRASRINPVEALRQD